jgi:hypothetical protein
MTRVDLDLQGRESRELLIEIRRLIEEARRQTTVVVNIGLTGLYWRVGERIQQEILGNERATYGEQIVVTVSRQLVADYGRALDRSAFSSTATTSTSTYCFTTASSSAWWCWN